jgi:hypothetical protein
MATKKTPKTLTVETPAPTFEEKISSGYYKTKLQWVSSRKDPEGQLAYSEDCARLSDEFRKDLLADLGITNHPKADLLFSKAYEMGHSSGRSEIYSYALDLVELIQ